MQKVFSELKQLTLFVYSNKILDEIVVTGWSGEYNGQLREVGLVGWQSKPDHQCTGILKD